MQVIAREGERLAHAPRGRLELQQGGELRLATVATVVNDEIAGNLFGQGGAVNFLDQGQRQIDAGGNAFGGPDAGVFYEYPGGVDADLGKAGLQHTRVTPLCRGSAAFL